MEQIFFDKSADEHIYSQYFDYQFRPREKLFGTIGLRNDEHSTGSKPSGRVTMAYKIDNNSKLRSSFGSGVRFPLYMICILQTEIQMHQAAEHIQVMDTPV